MARVRDFLLYTAIAVGVYVSLWFLAQYQIRTEQPPELPLKWMGFAAVTVLVFWDAIRLNRSSWGQTRFWLSLGSLLAIQCIAGVIVLLTMPKVPTLVWAVILPLDYVVVGMCLKLVLTQDE